MNAPPQDPPPNLPDKMPSDPPQILKPAGELDWASSAQHLAGIKRSIEAGSGPLIVDLTDVTYINSQGLRILIEARKLAGDAGRPLLLAGANREISEIFEIARIDTLVDIFPTLAAAVKACRPTVGTGGRRLSGDLPRE